MRKTSARLLALLSLLQARRDRPGSEPAERLAVSVRTVRPDVDRLRELGYPSARAAAASPSAHGPGPPSRRIWPTSTPGSKSSARRP